jgi:hypothetical protein
MNIDIQDIKTILKIAVIDKWVEWATMNDIDWIVSIPLISDFGTKFEVQMPETLVSIASGEEE